MNVMIVDDEELIRNGLHKILIKMPLELKVIGAYANGLEAVTEIGKLRPGALDVLITDIKMPVMDGLTLIEAAKHKLPSLCVLVLSGFNDFEYARRAMRFGVTDYFLKPIDKTQLYETLNAIRRRVDALRNVKHAVDSAPEIHHDHYVVDQVKDILETDYDKPLELERLADRIGLSTSYLSRLFKAETGITITDYVISIRMEKAKQFLTDHPNLKNYEISSLVGYSDPVYFNKLFKKMVGVTPKEFKDQHGEA